MVLLYAENWLFSSKFGRIAIRKGCFFAHFFNNKSHSLTMFPWFVSQTYFCLYRKFLHSPLRPPCQVPAAGVAAASLKKAERKLYNPYILILSFLLLRLRLFHPPQKCYQILIKVLFLWGLDVNLVFRFSKCFCGQQCLYLPVAVWLSFCIPAIHIIIVY